MWIWHMIRKKRHADDPSLRSSPGERPPDGAGGGGGGAGGRWGPVDTVGSGEELLHASPDMGCSDVHTSLCTYARRQRDEGSLFTCEHLTLEIWNVDSGLPTFTAAWSGIHVEVQLLHFFFFFTAPYWFVHQPFTGSRPTATKCDIYADWCFCGASCICWKTSHSVPVIHNSIITLVNLPASSAWASSCRWYDMIEEEHHLWHYTAVTLFFGCTLKFLWWLVIVQI